MQSNEVLKIVPQHEWCDLAAIANSSQGDFMGVRPRGIGCILNPLAGKFSEDTRKKNKGAKTCASHDWRSFYLSQYDWL